MVATAGRRNSRLWYIPLGVSAVAIIVFLVVFMSTRLAYRQDFSEGKRVISAVESFKKAHHRLPDSLGEMNIEERGVYYCKTKADGQYLVWFGTTLGQSMTYESQTGKWTDLTKVCGE